MATESPDWQDDATPATGRYPATLYATGRYPVLRYTALSGLLGILGLLVIHFDTNKLWDSRL
ncbi:hypothetical protein [Runella sp.]|uniref:hypothetical protein n=1 Tax=Runella sp. TaxID=1960881 RepID=UPI0026107E1B|nr:hypothetical protein [Runella sp.]